MLKPVLNVSAIFLILCCLTLLVYPISTLQASTQSTPSKITILDGGNATPAQLRNMVLVDARHLKICQIASVSGAKCLPANTFHSKDGYLASFYHIAWAFGTANLKATDDVLVFANKPQDRQALAGLLFLAGQHKVSYWSGKVAELQKILGRSSGQSRGIIRTHIYQGIMRDHYIALPNEIEKLTQNGWQLTSSSKIKRGAQSSAQPENIKRLISGKSPIKNIATFAQLQAEGHQQLRLSIDKQ